MTEKLITVVFILILVLFVVFILKDSGNWEKITGFIKKPKKFSKMRQTTLFAGPVIYVRYKGSAKYDKFEMTNTVFKIGRGNSADLCISKEYVSKRQAEIRKKNEDGRVFFTFTNLSKTNMTEYCNKNKKIFEVMDYKEQIDLEEKEVFYIGDVKLLIAVPSLGHEVSQTDRMDMIRDEVEETKTIHKNTGRIYTAEDFDI